MTPSDKGRLANLIVSDTYRTMLAVAQEMIETWHRDIPIGNTQFEYLKNCLERDGKIQGVDNFLKRLEALASTQ